MSGSNAAVEGLSGALGGVLALLTTYPLMTVQTLQSTRRKEEKQERESLTVPLRKQTGLLAEIAEIVSQAGWTGLYKGLKPSLLGTTISQGIYFYLYSILRQAAVKLLQGQGKSRNGNIGVGLSLLVAFCAGCGNVVITTPIWVVATRMQAEQKQHKEGPKSTPLGVTKEIYEESGIAGLWRGMVPSLIMVTNPAVNYMLYESFTAQLMKVRRGQASKNGKPSVGPPTAAEVLLVSAAAKLGATVVTYPLQLIKARQMSAGKHTHADRQYTGTLNAIMRIWKTEGFLGFYKGMRTKILQSILAAALLMAVKEKLTEAALLLLNPSVAPAPKLLPPSVRVTQISTSK